VSNVIDFLERFGQDAQLRHATGDLLEEAIRNAGLDPELKAAILGKDSRALEKLIGVVPNVCCAVFKEDEEEEEEEDEDDEEEGDDEKDDE
jgi:hypothetical protein